MKRYLPKNAEDASALILTLLVIVLLSTVVTSFLSSTRTEQTATRNYTSKTQAEQFASSATQQAMANLQAAFNGNGNGTAIVTSQPGGITKYFFKNGTCTQNPTANLFFTANYTNANGTVNMNNLDNSTNSTISGLITGNSSEAITVARVEVKDSSGNQTIGRIAYYIDDEGTKINLNSLAGNKTTLNAGYGKAQSLSGVVSSTINGSANYTGNLSVVDAIINGTASSNNTSITNWTSFFRPEQAQVSLSINASQIKHYSAAPPSDFHLKYTPWGTRRLFINDETIDDAGVCNIYSALTGLNATTGAVSAAPNSYEINGMALRNIFNGTFSDKYSSNGTKQIAANILQMRDKNTINGDFKWRGPILGSGNLSALGIPQSYFAFVPFPVINEVAIQPEKDEANSLLHLCVYVEIWPIYFNQIANDGLPKELVVQLNSASFTTVNSTVSFAPASSNQTLPAGDTNSSKRIARFDFTAPTSNFNGTLSVNMGDIRLLAKPGNATSIRDWIEGSVINKLLPISTSINSTNTVNWTVGDSINIPNDNNATSTTNGTTAWNTTINLTSIQRKDVRISHDSSGNYSFANNSSTSPWGVNPHTLCSASSAYNQIINFKSYAGSATAGRDTNPGNSIGLLAHQFGDVQARGAAGAVSFVRSGYLTSDWPSDILSQDEVCINFRYFCTNRYFRPTLNAKDSNGNGVYIWPGDLGKVMTDRMFRTLRMFWQPTQERVRGFIPDWALLDLVSFSSNQSAKFPLKMAPMNPNGSFNCLAAPTPRPRNNIQCLTKPFDSSLNLASSIAQTITPRSYFTINMTTADWLCVGANASISMSSNLTNQISSNSSIAWTKSGNQTWNSYRISKNWPSSRLILPSETSEIKSVSDSVDWPTSADTSEKNENRLAAFFPGLTFCSNFFTIFAYAQAGKEINGTFVPDSEHLTKTLVEVEITTPATTTTSAVYKVKSLYTQSIPMGE